MESASRMGVARPRDMGECALHCKLFRFPIRRVPGFGWRCPWLLQRKVPMESTGLRAPQSPAEAVDGPVQKQVY